MARQLEAKFRKCGAREEVKYKEDVELVGVGVGFLQLLSVCLVYVQFVLCLPASQPVLTYCLPHYWNHFDKTKET